MLALPLALLALVFAEGRLRFQPIPMLLFAATIRSSILFAESFSARQPLTGLRMTGTSFLRFR
jgi:hypothetical protein